jgi:CRP-like cAMP-binding protein
MTSRFKPRIAPRPLETVARRLRTLAPLTDAEMELLSSLSDRRERHAPGDELMSEGQTARRPRFLVTGWAASQRMLSDGRRQIFGIFLPGDGIGICERPAPPALSAVAALTALETVDAEPVLEAVQAGRAPGLGRALSISAVLDQMRMLDHIVRLGQQTAYERLAHFLLEMQRRMEAAGLGDAQRFPLPLTQEMLADALGLSIVHVNRTLQQLRRERLIELRSGVAILLQPDALASIADYRAHKVAPAARAAELQPLNRSA